jgi:RNA polymerase sigma-70 factor (ECF subfamily)
VVLCDVLDFSYEEISLALDIPVGTVRSRIHRGRARLRASVEAMT